jgi:hypothetical protein
VNSRLSYYTGAREKAEGEIQQTEKEKSQRCKLNTRKEY